MAAVAGHAGALLVAVTGVDVLRHKPGRHLQRSGSGRPLHRLEVAVRKDPLSNQRLDVRVQRDGNLLREGLGDFFLARSPARNARRRASANSSLARMKATETAWNRLYSSV